MRELKYSSERPIGPSRNDFGTQLSELFIDIRYFRLCSNRFNKYVEAQGTRNRDSLLTALTQQVNKWVETDFPRKGKAACVGLVTSLEADNGELAAGILARIRWYYADGAVAV